MRRLCSLLAAFAVILCAAGQASAQWRIATWNISNYSGGRAADIRTSVYGVYQGRQFAPDILCIQEVNSASAAGQFLLILNNDPASPGDWAVSQFVDGPDTDAILLYRTSKAQLVRNTTIVALAGGTSGQPRHTYRWDLRPVGYGNTPAATLAVYGTHMKAGSTSDDQARRLIEATAIRNNTSGIDTAGPGTGLPAGYRFIVLGDLNIQTSTQAAYQMLVGSQADNSGRVFDPIARPGSWNNNIQFRMLHTQDPFGPGGMDDRFDQILVSGSLLNGIGGGMGYIGTLTSPQNPVPWNLGTFWDTNHSHRCWGNDGVNFDGPLNIGTNQMVGPVIAQALVNASDGVSGHLPVYLDLRVPAKAATSASLSFGTVDQGAPPPTRLLLVENSGDVGLWTVQGIDTLVYSLAASAGFTAPSGTFLALPGANTSAHPITMSTATPGPKSGTVVITTNDPDRPLIVVTLSGTVLPPNVPPVAVAGPDQTLFDADTSGDELVLVDGSASFDPDGTIVDYRWSLGPTILAQGASPTASFLLPLGSHTVTLRVTDNRGATATDSLIVTIAAACDPDFNQDGNVDQDDVACLAQVVAGDPTCSDADPDFNRDGNVDQDDIDALAQVVAGAGCP